MSTTEPIRDRRITSIHPLISPSELRSELPLTAHHEASVLASREALVEVLRGTDERLLVVVGPCSIHDPTAGLDYARRLAALTAELEHRLLVVARVYFEKPRTTVGWKGLINDPGLDGSFDVNRGLRTARRLLLEIVELGLPVGCEFLDPISPQYLADAVTWGSIGARTAQSQVHRQLASGLSMPIGIKNPTDGDVQAAVDAVSAASVSHVFTGITEDGQAAIFTTSGNPECHVVLRGSSAGPNYDSTSVAEALDRLRRAGLSPRLVIDASHGNSAKDHLRQAEVVGEIATRLAEGEDGIAGIMLESFLEPGRQNLVLGQADKL
ncbi:MAG: 3-deoxy-7-phosphoheptulonate synthase, partial [Acidimicrobiales bacterium]